MAKRGYGQRIKDARKAAGYSQKRLMDALGWPNDSNSRMSGYELEEREPVLSDFERIAKLCHVDPAFLAFGEHRIDPFHAKLIAGYENSDDSTQRIVRGALLLAERTNQKKAAD